MSAETSVPDAQQLITQVAAAHELRYDEWAVLDREFYRCNCGMETPLGEGANAEWWHGHLAAEIDKALGGLRKFTAIGHLLPSGVLLSGVEPTQYLQWISGWTAEAVS